MLCSCQRKLKPAPRWIQADVLSVCVKEDAWMHLCRAAGWHWDSCWRDEVAFYPLLRKEGKIYGTLKMTILSKCSALFSIPTALLPSIIHPGFQNVISILYTGTEFVLYMQENREVCPVQRASQDKWHHAINSFNVLWIPVLKDLGIQLHASSRTGILHASAAVAPFTVTMLLGNSDGRFIAHECF